MIHVCLDLIGRYYVYDSNTLKYIYIYTVIYIHITNILYIYKYD